MQPYKDPFRLQIEEAVKRALKEMAESHPQKPELPVEQILQNMTEPPKFELGQVALPCHSLAKVFRSSPIKIAEDLKARMQSYHLSLVERIEVVNGYLNFFVAISPYGEKLFSEIESEMFFSKPLLDESAREKISVEYSQPNTHKALHVGHLRNMVFGDSVCNLLEYAGHQVVRTTYPGDMGAHIAKSLWYIKTKKGGSVPVKDQADWLGDMYAESGDYVNSLEGSSDELRVKQEIGQVLKQLQEGHGEYFELYKTTREFSLTQQKQIYQWLGIRFDVWFFESACDQPSRELVLKKFQEGFFKKSDGAIGLDLNEYGLGFALYLKSDGNGLYLTKDLELIRVKFSDPAVTKSIVVVDARQKLHFQQLFKTAELMGYPQAKKSVHLSYETVTTPDGKPCSSRNLNGIQLSHLRETMESKVIKDYLENYRGVWGDSEISDTARVIALGALKYGFLKVDANMIIRFVMDEWLKLEGDTGPYLQYVHARCSSVLEKVGRPKQKKDLVFETAYESELLWKLGRFNEVVLQAANTYRPSIVGAYLFDLCRLFNRFYKECPIKTTAGSQLDTRLALVEDTAIVLRHGLSLLGIEAPLKM